MKFIIFPLLIFILSCSNTYIHNNLNNAKYNNNINDFTLNYNWWKEYKDAQLEYLINQAIENNYELFTNRIISKTALHKVNILKSQSFPTFSSSGEYKSEKYGYKGNLISNNWQVDNYVSYEVDLWGKSRDAIKAGELELHATEYDLDSLKLYIINRILDLYFYISYLSSSITIIENQMNIYQQIINKSNIKFRLGSIANFELLESKQAYQELNSILLSYKQAILDSKQELCNILNCKFDTVDEIVYPCITNIPTLNLPSSIPLSYLSHRPDVKSAEFKVLKALKNIDISHKNFYPSITIELGMNNSEEHSYNIFNLPLYIATIRVNLPFLKFGELLNELEISKLEYQDASKFLEHTLVMAINELHHSILSYKNSITKFYALGENLNVNTSIENYYKNRYDLGAAEISDWFSSTIKKLDVELERLYVYYQTIKYNILIFKSLGGKPIQ